MNKYDIIIVGAGPSGTSAGIILASHGKKVLIVDKDKFPRNKLCGGLLTQKAVDILENKLKLKKIRELLISKANGYEIYYKNKFINKVISNQSIYFINRKDFDYYLLENAKNKGCDFIGNTIVNEVTNNYIKIRGNKVYYDYLIGADGANSIIRKKINQNLKKDKIGVGLQVDIKINQSEKKEIYRFPKIYFGYLKYGWAWVFPKGDYISIGLGGLKNKSMNIKKVFLSFLKDIKINNIKNIDIKGAILPYGTFLKKPADKNIFLVGDAAGFVDPITGEGLYYSILSGSLAAKSILSNEPNKDIIYINACKNNIISSLKTGCRLRHLLFRNPFKILTLYLLRKNKRYMLSFMNLLSGNIDHKKFILNIIKHK